MLRSPAAVGRAPPPERLSPIHPLGHGKKKEKEKKTTFPRKVQLGKSRGNPQDRKTTRCLILLRAGGWRVLNRSCDHVLRKTRFSTLQTLVTGGGQIVRLWSASLGGSKGRPITRATDRRERVSERARGDGQGGDAGDSRGDSERPTDTRCPPRSQCRRSLGPPGAVNGLALTFFQTTDGLTSFLFFLSLCLAPIVGYDDDEKG